MKQLTNAQIFDFKSNPLFIGTYVAEAKFEKDGDDHKKGDLLGYRFADADGVECIIGASATVEKVMKDNKIKPGAVMSFEFQGQGLTAKKKTFNKFEIFSFDSMEEAETYHKVNEAPETTN